MYHCLQRSILLIALALIFPGCKGDVSSTSTDSIDRDKIKERINEASVPMPPPDGVGIGDEVVENSETVVMWSDPALMESADDHGLSLSAVLGADEQQADESDRSLEKLAEYPSFAGVVEVLEEDLQGFQDADSRLGVSIARFPHRLFDPAWLRSSTTHFELVALVSRLDRRPFVENACGEIRLVYRLAYDAVFDEERVSSRLPMTLTVDWLEEAPEDGDCTHVADRWAVPEEILDEGVDAAWLTSEEGPASVQMLASRPIHRMQINVQSVRWPSTIQPSLAGHAEYVLRSFVPDLQGRLIPEKLENSPDIDALNDDQSLRQDLLAWLGEPENLERIDDGTAVLPERFLTERAISVAPRGLSRTANRPFAQILSEAELQELDFDGLDQVRSPAGLVRRLDDHSCAGCHQGRAVAGFHFLGEDSDSTFYANALAVPFSAHSADETRRRTTLHEAEIGDNSPAYQRPFSERDQHDSGAYGTPCGLTDDATFRTWDCADGLTCRAYDLSADQPHIGICLPDEGGVGDPCEIGTVRSGTNPHHDRIVSAEQTPCPDGQRCNVNRVGFPGGMCTASCNNPGPDGRCGAIAILAPFNQCLAAEKPFEHCLSEHVNPAGLRACDEENPCRHDYICARNADSEGVCIPPYFLFQMRVDGHPVEQD